MGSQEATYEDSEAKASPGSVTGSQVQGLHWQINNHSTTVSQSKNGKNTAAGGDKKKKDVRRNTVTLQKSLDSKGKGWAHKMAG